MKAERLLQRVEELTRSVERLEIERRRLEAELLRFKPEPMSQDCRDGRHYGRCSGCCCLCHPRGES